MSRKSEPKDVLFPASFAKARLNFTKNLNALLSHLGYTAAGLALKLNTVCDSDTVSASEVYEWVAGTKIPGIYHLYKLSVWLHMPMDALFSNSFDAAAVNGRSYAQQPITYSVSEEPLKPSADSKENLMATKTNIVSIARSTKKQMEQTVTARTDSKAYNLLLANKIYNSEMSLKEIAATVGASTRSLRDYAFYGTTVPSNIAENLVKMFKTSYRNLGLQYNEDRDRYEHMSVKVKA